MTITKRLAISSLYLFNNDNLTLLLCFYQIR